MGPPTTNRPVGLMKYLVLPVTRRAGSTGLMTSSITTSRKSLYFTLSLCWVEMTTASMATGWFFSS